ncbi:MAG: SDR family oxidoreductase [SAR324 cluster bacterium]|nr:SDR family oxidoreductase [SAR324 cluster bacterium]
MSIDVSFLKDLYSLDNQVAIVTGGMGQLGRRFSETLAKAGANVIILDVNINKPHPLLTLLAAEYPIDFYQADITQKSQLTTVADEIEKKWGKVSILVNNAALDSPPNSPQEETGPFENYPEESWDKVLDVNLKGTFHTCQVFGSRMVDQGYGRIVNISSIYGMVSPNQTIYEYRRGEGTPFFKPVAYSVSKSGLLNLTRYLATLWAKHNVHVNTLTLAGVFNHQDERFLKNYTALMPKGRMAEEGEYMGALLLLCSKASSYITGSNLVADGGWTAW